MSKLDFKSIKLNYNDQTGFLIDSENFVEELNMLGNNSDNVGVSVISAFKLFPENFNSKCVLVNDEIDYSLKHVAEKVDFNVIKNTEYISSQNEICRGFSNMAYVIDLKMKTIISEFEAKDKNLKNVDVAKEKKLVVYHAVVQNNFLKHNIMGINQYIIRGIIKFTLEKNKETNRYNLVSEFAFNPEYQKLVNARNEQLVNIYNDNEMGNE